MRGNCYVASEALYHLLGGKDAGWKPMYIKHEGESHWFLQHKSGMILDITVSQFQSIPNYSNAKGKGFLTRSPSRKARKLMRSLVWQKNI